MDTDDAATLQQNNSSSKLETVPTSSVDTATTNHLADTTNPNGTLNSNSSSPLRPEIQILKDEHSALLRENEMLKEIWERIIQQSEKVSTSTTTTSKCNNYNNVVSSDNNNNNKGDDANIEDEMKNLHLEQQQQQYSSETPQMTPLSSDCDEDTSNEQGVPNTIDISDRSRESCCFADEPSDFDRSNTNITDHQQSDQQQNQQQQQEQQQQLEKRKFNYRRRSDEEEPIDYFEIYS